MAKKQLDWHALSPARPLMVGDERYVPRPWGGGDRLAMLVSNGLTPIAVTGPVGSGKTTEMFRALQSLDDGVLGMEVPLDLLVRVEAMDPDVLVYELAQHLLDKTLEGNPDAVPSRALVNDIRASDPRLPRGSGIHHKPAALAELVVAEVCKLVKKPRLALFLDGLDRVGPDQARAAVRALLALRYAADLVVVVPPALANGPDSHEVLAHMRVFWVPTVPVHTKPGLAYLRKIALQRLGLKRLVKGLGATLDRAAETSGGITRLYLHLVQDAAFYAVADGKDRPTKAAMAAAIRDRTDAMRRVMVAGDLEALRDAADTDGLDVPPDRKVRLLSHNLLLEYADGEDRVVRPHPLVQRLIARREASGRQAR